MKSRNPKRRTDQKFNSIDEKTGYSLVVERAKDGYWWAYAPAFGAGGFGLTIRAAKIMAAEGIQIHLENSRERAYEVPAPENAPSA